MQKFVALLRVAGVAAVFMGCCNLASAAVTGPYPSIQISGGPSPPTNVCNGASYSLPLIVNERSLNSDIGTMFVPGVGQVFSFTENDPTAQGVGSYGVTPSAFSVPNGTPVTFIIRTFNGNNATGGQAYQSTIVFACDTGAVISISNVVVEVPTMSEWALMLMSLLVAASGAALFYRRRNSRA